jgi:hypothetical protein
LHTIDETHPSKLNQRSALPGKHTLFTGVSLRALPPAVPCNSWSHEEESAVARLGGTNTLRSTRLFYPLAILLSFAVMRVPVFRGAIRVPAASYPGVILAYALSVSILA